MVPLQNSAIERPESLYEVELVIFGTISSSAARRSVSVLAQTARGARRICLSHYRRAEIRRTRRAGAAPDRFETTQTSAWRQATI
ncbi:hypothetical protein RY831_11905 [Noviherbaspirillum sp. CPCC 100848]|uniref:Uncharacterized protein n=1 Tax=Noviherbaspirillum album TaxID=3080276 RepID=A0ABU6J883_9BURK|nr:hypothetical protein [Noviherbaspirillum sp. CPCC 100848]MEC4719857.1 hypothetical protein [Noviherbaspirillum sp. CPCC 100848]